MVRYEAAASLSAIDPGRRDVCAALGAALRDADQGVRFNAARGMERAGRDAAGEAGALLEAQRTDPDGLVREAAADALRAIHGMPAGLSGPYEETAGASGSP
jgi:HEAT repeat protein